MNDSDTYSKGLAIQNKLKKIWLLYYDGFRNMTVGKALWVIILLKLFVLFVVIRLIFFPDLLQRDYDNDRDRAEHVRQELTSR